MNTPTDASLFHWRKDSTTGETNDLVTDADVLRRTIEILFREKGRHPDRVDTTGTLTVLTDLQWLASRLESEPSSG